MSDAQKTDDTITLPADTPRSNAAICRLERNGAIADMIPWGPVVPATVARELERENHKLRAACELARTFGKCEDQMDRETADRFYELTR